MPFLRRNGVFWPQILGLLTLWVAGLKDARGWPTPTSAPAHVGTNITRKIRRALADVDPVRAMAALSPEATRVRVVFVKGLLGDFIPGYGRPNVEAMKAAGFAAEFAPTSTVGPMAPDVAKLEQIVLETRRPILFVAHSQGAAKVSQALANLNAVQPEVLRKNVRGHLALAPAYGGSPIADVLAEYRVGRAFATGLTKVLGGSPEAIYDLRTSVRHEATASHPMPVDVVPTLCLVAYQRSLLTLRAPTLLLLKRGFGLVSDGMVAHRDAVIPGSDVVRLPLDHVDPVIGPTGEKLTLVLAEHLFSMPYPAR